VAPILLLLVFGTIDIGRTIMVSDLLTHAAATGCRVGVLPGNGNTDINNAVSTALANSGIKGAGPPTIDVMPAGQSTWTSPGDAGSAKPDDALRVTVSVSYKQVSWLSFNWFMAPNATLSGSVVMSKE
jgi:Flp pilus assembly protein TadG